MIFRVGGRGGVKFQCHREFEWRVRFFVTHWTYVLLEKFWRGPYILLQTACSPRPHFQSNAWGQWQCEQDLLSALKCPKSSFYCFLWKKRSRVIDHGGSLHKMLIIFLSYSLRVAWEAPHNPTSYQSSLWPWLLQSKQMQSPLLRLPCSCSRKAFSDQCCCLWCFFPCPRCAPAPGMTDSGPCAFLASTSQTGPFCSGTFIMVHNGLKWQYETFVMSPLFWLRQDAWINCSQTLLFCSCTQSWLASFDLPRKAWFRCWKWSQKTSVCWRRSVS